MAGHSKWANIQHRKGRQDKIRAKLFSKLSKEITVAAKMGDPDPDKNPRLRLAVKEAKSSSVPKDVIDRAIKKSQGGDAENYEEIRYEGYGPNGIALVVEAMTDNRNRTASNVRHQSAMPTPSCLPPSRRVPTMSRRTRKATGSIAPIPR